MSLLYIWGIFYHWPSKPLVKVLFPFPIGPGLRSHVPLYGKIGLFSGFSPGPSGQAPCTFPKAFKRCYCISDDKVDDVIWERFKMLLTMPPSYKCYSFWIIHPHSLESVPNFWSRFLWKRICHGPLWIDYNWNENAKIRNEWQKSNLDRIQCTICHNVHTIYESNSCTS